MTVKAANVKKNADGEIGCSGGLATAEKARTLIAVPLHCKIASTTRSTLMPFMQRKSIGYLRRKHGETARRI